MIENKLTKLAFDRSDRHFVLWDKSRKIIEKGTFGLWWRENGDDKHTFISQLDQVEVEELVHSVKVTGRHSAGWNMTWEAKLCDDEVGIEVEMKFENISNAPIELVDAILLEGEYVKPDGVSDKWWVFENGWQSWSPSVSRSGIRASKLPRFLWLRDINLGSLRYRSTWLKRGILSEMVGRLTTVDSDESLILGTLTTNQGFTEVFTDKNKFRVTCQAEIKVPVGSSWESDRVIAFTASRATALDTYADKVAKAMHIKKIRPPMTGWCSWYWYGPAINHQNLLSELEIMKKLSQTLPLKVFLIDGGWSKWGEWLTPYKSKFPQGLKSIAQKTVEAGFIPGLWLAPFMIQRGSDIYRNHPEWLLRDKHNRPLEVRKITASSLVNEIGGLAMYGLDPTHPEAQKYLVSVMKTVVNDWGFRYLKLDFLYGACMGEIYYQSMSRLEALRAGLKVIREAVGDEIYILGCGCPIEAGVGIIDALRIGLDTGQPLTRTIPVVGGVINDFCYRRARQNVEARSFMNSKWWNNDPDCILVADSQQLHATEKEAMTSLLRRVGGQVFLGDSLKEITDEHIEKYLRPLFEEKT